MEIVNWKEITTPDNLLRPVVFFIPSLEFLTHINNRGMLNIPIQIAGTNFYDGTYVVNIDRKTDMIQCFHYTTTPRPLILTAVLDRDFTVIPPNKGTVTLYQPSEEGFSSLIQSSSDEEMQDPPSPSSTPTPVVPSLQLWHVIVILFMILLLVMICFAPYIM